MKSRWGISWEFDPLRWMVGVWVERTSKYININLSPLPMLMIQLWVRRWPM